MTVYCIGQRNYRRYQRLVQLKPKKLSKKTNPLQEGKYNFLSVIILLFLNSQLRVNEKHSAHEKGSHPFQASSYYICPGFCVKSTFIFSNHNGTPRMEGLKFVTVCKDMRHHMSRPKCYLKIWKGFLHAYHTWNMINIFAAHDIQSYIIGRQVA